MIKAAVAGALAVAVLASAALFAAVRPFDGEARKSEVAAAVEALVGRSVDIRGPLTLELGWPPRLRAADMRIDEGASISTVELHVAPFALAAGDVEIEGARLIGLELTVDREAMAAAVEALAASDTLRRLSVVGGRIDYGAEDTSETVALDFELASDAPGGAWLAEGAAVWRGLTFAGAVSLNRPAPGADAAIRARVESGGAVLAFEGAAPRGGVRGRLTLRGEAEDVAPLLAAAGGPAAFAPAPGVGLEADARIRYEDGALTAEDATLRLGRESISGRLALSADAPRRIDLTLSGGRLDLDALFEDSGASWRGAGEGFPLAGVRGRVDAAFDAVVWRGRVARQAALDLDIEDNGATLRRLSAALPGGSEVSLSGRLSSGPDRPPFDGEVEAASDNLRALLDWIGVATTGVPADRLRRFELAASVAGGLQSGKIFDIAASLDTTTVSGSASYAFDPRPAFALALRVDRLDADAYLPRDGLARFATDAPTFDARVILEIDALSAARAAMRDVLIDAALEDGAFTLREARIGDLAGARLSASGALTDLGEAPSLEGEIHVRSDDPGAFARALPITRRWPAFRSIAGAGSLDARVSGGREAVDIDARASLAGAELRLRGAVVEPAEAPLYDLAAELESAHPALLFEALGAIDAGAAPPLLATPLSLEAEILGGGGTIAFDATAELGGGQWSLSGETGAGDEERRFRLEAKARYPDFSRLLRLSGSPDNAEALAAPASGVLTAAGTGRAFALEAAFDLAGGALSFSGDVRDDSDGPALEAVAEFEHPALEALLAAFGLAAETPGRVAARGTVFGDATGWRVHGLDAVLAGNRIAGDIALDTAAPRPKLTGALTADRAAAAFFLPFRDDDGGALDLSALRAADAELALRAGLLDVYGHAFKDAEATLSLADGVLEVESLNGRLFGGAASATGRLSARGGAHLEGMIDIAGMDAARALDTLAGISSVSGPFDARFEFSTVGENARRMLLALDGRGAFHGAGGAIDGFDLSALSAALAAARDNGRAADLSAATAGRTLWRALGGAFEISGGRLLAPELRLSAAGAEAVVAIDTNLVARRHRVTTTVAFAAHEGLPPLTLYRDGPVNAPRRGADIGALAANAAGAE